jgi:hypothetical protein
MTSSECPPSIQAAIDATKVSYAQLGSPGLRASVPILGCMSFGDNQWADWVPEEKEALEVLKGVGYRGIVVVYAFDFSTVSKKHRP